MEMEQVAKTALPAKIKARKVKTLNQGYWQRRYGVFYLMMAPALIVLLINNYVPMIGGLIAFKNMTYESRAFSKISKTALGLAFKILNICSIRATHG
nr:hypothetical protein [Cohnella faecalis]